MDNKDVEVKQEEVVENTAPSKKLFDTKTIIASIILLALIVVAIIVSI